MVADPIPEMIEVIETACRSLTNLSSIRTEVIEEKFRDDEILGHRHDYIYIYIYIVREKEREREIYTYIIHIPIE